MSSPGPAGRREETTEGTAPAHMSIGLLRVLRASAVQDGASDRTTFARAIPSPGPHARNPASALLDLDCGLGYDSSAASEHRFGGDTTGDA